MAEYIERKRLLAAISRFIITKNAADFTHYEEGRDDAISEVLKTIEKLPAADVRPERHGHWIYQEPDDEFSWKPYLCSACGEKGGKNYTEFCSHCGAKMDGKDGE